LRLRRILSQTDDGPSAFRVQLAQDARTSGDSNQEPEYHFGHDEASPGRHAMDERTRTEVEAAVLRRLISHLQARTDVQNIDLMTTGGFCRNCLGDWYREAAAERGIDLNKEDARAHVYGMPQEEWKRRYQRKATPEQRAAFAAASSSAATSQKK
jgi:hypothetical protein